MVLIQEKQILHIRRVGHSMDMLAVESTVGASLPQVGEIMKTPYGDMTVVKVFWQPTQISFTKCDMHIYVFLDQLRIADDPGTSFSEAELQQTNSQDWSK